MPAFGSNQWIAIVLGLLPIALGFSLVLLEKLGGPEFMSYCQIAVPVLTGIGLGGSAAVKILGRNGAEG
jgi:hypothetical protein